MKDNNLIDASLTQGRAIMTIENNNQLLIEFSRIPYQHSQGQITKLTIKDNNLKININKTNNLEVEQTKY